MFMILLYVPGYFREGRSNRGTTMMNMEFLGMTISLGISEEM